MAEKRKPRKKGQHTGSPNHSDLYTNEREKGTIRGLGFKDATTARKGVATVNKAKRTHAHKVQATLVMKQRAKVAKERAKDPEKKKNLNAAYKIWSDHLEKLKKKTAKKNEGLVRQYVRSMLEFSIKANKKNTHQDGTSKSRGYMSGVDKTWTGEDTNDELHSWYKRMGLMEASNMKVTKNRLRKIIRERLKKFSSEDFKDVYNTARMAHVGQTRRDGSEYFSHPSEVRNIARNFYPKDNVVQMAALLHDSLEDAPGLTMSSAEEMEDFIRGSIQDQGSADEVIRVVRALTHEKGGSYTDYVLSLLGDVPTLRVKLADMVHNLSDSPSPKQKAKYKTALNAISSQTGGRAPSGISSRHWEKLLMLTENRETKILRLAVRQIISEKGGPVPYNQWTMLAAGDPRRELVKQNLFDLVQQTYEPIGGHFKISSPDSLDRYTYWVVKDIDEDPDIDVAIMGKPDIGGVKMGAAANDGSGQAASEYKNKSAELRAGGSIDGIGNWWGEVSGKPAYAMISRGAKAVEDEAKARQLLDGDDIEWHGEYPLPEPALFKTVNGWYTKRFGDKSSTKIILGNPR